MGNLTLEFLKQEATNNRLIRRLFGLIIVTTLLLINCTPPEPVTVSVVELSACTGWDINNEPSGISETFLSTEKQILACGRIKTNRSITLSVNWYHLDPQKRVFRETINGVSNRFYSTYKQPGESFPEGNYKIEVVIDKDIVSSTEFQVKQP